MVDGHTTLYGFIAHPARHSMSPLIHNTAFNELGLNSVYLAFDVQTAEIEPIFKSMRAMEIGGFNLSMPFKQTVLPHLDSLSDTARKLGAVNTVVNDHGFLAGYSTDGDGFIAALAHENVDVIGKHVTVLGAGGAAKSIVLALVKANSGKVTVFKRNNDSFAEVKKEMTSWGDQVSVVPFDDEAGLENAIKDSDIVVNGTNVGMAGDNHVPLTPSQLANLHPNQVVFDAIYFPLVTPLLEVAKQKGCHVMNGTGMLVFQAAAAFKLWTGMNMPIDSVMNAVKKEVANRQK